MRTRLLVCAVAVLAVCLAASVAFAVVPPPFLSVASPTNAPALSWDDVGSEQGYRVFRAPGDCSGSPVFAQVGADLDPDELDFTDSLLTPDGTYCYAVRSFDGDGESANSNLVPVVYERVAPTAPGTPAGSTPTALAPALTFTAATDAGSGIDHYDVYRDGLKVNSSAIPAGGPYAWTDDALNSLAPVSASGSYSYVVRAVDAAGNFTNSSPRVILYDVTVPTAPGTPAGLTPTALAPALTFTAASDADAGIDHYDVYRDGLKVNSSAIPAGGPYAWTDDALNSSAPVSASGSYSYVVRAVDAAGNFTNSAAKVILYDVTVPTAPGTPAGSTPTALAPALTFTAATDADSGIDHYDVYRNGSKVNVSAIAAGGPYTWSDVAGQSSPAVSVSGSYSYVVRAVDAAGNFTNSSPRVVVYDVTVPTAPGTPAGATPTALAPTLTFTAATDADSGIDHYDVYRNGSKVNVSAIAAGGPYTWSDVAGQSSPAVSASGSYSYVIRAFDGVGHTTDSSPRVIVYDVTVPTAPGTPAGSTPTASVPALTFTAATDADAGIDHYDVYRNGSKVNVSAIAAGGPYTWSDVAGQSSPAVSASGSYSYVVRAVDAAGNFTNSSPRVIVYDVTVPTAPGTPAGSTPTASVPALTFTAATDADAGIDHYDVYRNGSKVNVSAIAAGGPYTWSDVAGQSSPAVTASGSYSYVIRAFDGVGHTTDSSPRVIVYDITPPTTPGTPTGLTPVASAPSINFTALTDANSSIDHYDVYRNGSLTPIGPPVPAGGPYTWTDTAAVASGTYTYTVVAVDAVGNASPHSLVGSFVVDTALSAPTSVTALATPTTQRPQITWVAPAAPGFTVHHYKVYRAGVFVQDVTSGTTYTDNSVSLADGAYTYRVVAAEIGDATLGIASAPVTIVYDTTAPAAPGGVAAAAALDGSVGISWAAASDGAGSGVTRYVVRRSLSSSAPVSAADGDATCQGLFTSCADATTLNGKLYSYSVFAVDAVGNTSVAGSSVAVTARDQLAPAVPKGLAATPGDGSVDLHWSAAGADDDVAGYVLVAKQGAVAPVSEADGTRVCTTIVAASTACSATGLTNGATYTFGLFALDEALNRSQAAVVSAAPNGKVPDTKAPAAVTKLRAKVSGRTVTLTWKNPADRDFDHVVITADKRKPAARAAATRVYTGKGTKATTKLAAGQSRWFTVVAYDDAGNASPAASVRATVAVPSRFGPEPNAKVHGKVRLTWPVVKGARYYNVQVYAGKKRILVSWPAGGKLQLPQAKLKRGKTYTWYVWPGLGAKAKAHYGKLIGKSTFVFTG